MNLERIQYKKQIRWRWPEKSRGGVDGGGRGWDWGYIASALGLSQREWKRRRRGKKKRMQATRGAVQKGRRRRQAATRRRPRVFFLFSSCSRVEASWCDARGRGMREVGAGLPTQLARFRVSDRRIRVETAASVHPACIWVIHSVFSVNTGGKYGCPCILYFSARLLQKNPMQTPAGFFSLARTYTPIHRTSHNPKRPKQTICYAY